MGKQILETIPSRNVQPLLLLLLLASWEYFGIVLLQSMPVEGEICREIDRGLLFHNEVLMSFWLS